VQYAALRILTQNAGSSPRRGRLCQGPCHLGVRLDEERHEKDGLDRQRCRKVRVVATDKGTSIARHTRLVLANESTAGR
jgi:hypothetical protein